MRLRRALEAALFFASLAGLVLAVAWLVGTEPWRPLVQLVADALDWAGVPFHPNTQGHDGQH